MNMESMSTAATAYNKKKLVAPYVVEGSCESKVIDQFW